MYSMRILLVDDEERYLKSTARLLGRKGFSVMTASNGNEALAVLSQEAVDVVVLDVMMPGMDGFEVLKIIKQQYPMIKVIMLSGNPTLESEIKGSKAGAFAYILKPVDVHELISEISS